MDGVESIIDGWLVLDVYLWICFERMVRALTMDSTKDVYA